ncbi:MAG: hypothetical protein ACYCZD_08970 [Rhodanobacter sp.]
MMLALKPYQEKALEALGGSAPVLPYRPFSDEAPELPIACLRIPTGGGKTLMAAMRSSGRRA